MKYFKVTLCLLFFIALLYVSPVVGDSFFKTTATVAQEESSVVINKRNIGDKEYTFTIRYLLSPQSGSSNKLIEDFVLYESKQDAKKNKMIRILKEEKENRWNIELTKEEIYALAEVMMLECGGEEDDGQQAAIESVFNRMYSDLFPNTVIEVLSQSNPDQYSTWKNRSTAIPSERIFKNINEVLNGNTSILPFETMYFSAKGFKDYEVEIVIGGHVFCNQPER